jgi:3-deoxy-manno-octulosonate cytidylyltransferase (CMP-KDO synthetase)
MLGVIPARYGSSRFPGKPLVDIGGQTLIQRVYRQASEASCLTRVVVATDDKRIYEHVRSFGGEVVMTAETHLSGTDRCAEVAAAMEGYDIVVNIQGDEPFIDPKQIELLVQPLLLQQELGIATLALALQSQEDIQNPNIVKVVMNKLGHAMYFSRSPIPFIRDVPSSDWGRQPLFFKHIGLYAFKPQILQSITALPPGVYERAESLEQLRWLATGYTIAVSITDRESVGVDTPEDLEKVRRMIMD